MTPEPADIVYDLIGLGFGPANLAIAGALIEKWDTKRRINDDGKDPSTRKNVLFIEKHDKFRWHPGMLLPNARMQISFLKDLATLRSPQSPLTFLAYLHSQDRLVSYINRGSTTPTRKEYADYLSWAAQFVYDGGIEVNYGEEIIGLDEGPGATIQIQSKNVVTGIVTILRARNIVLSPGGSPRIPQAISAFHRHPLVIHSSVYASSIRSILSNTSQTSPIRVAVIGSGQSAAEVMLDLREQLASLSSKGTARSEIDMIIRKGSIKPSDDSPFANEIFNPSTTDSWFSQRGRESRLIEYKSTNYGVVNSRTLQALYEVIYDQKVDEGIARRTGTTNASMHPHITIKAYSSILSGDLTVDPSDSESESIKCERPPNKEQRSFTLVIQNTLTRAIHEQTYNVIICATGYEHSSWIPLLQNSDIGKYFGIRSPSSIVRLSPFVERNGEVLAEAFAQDVYHGAAFVANGSPSGTDQSFEIPSSSSESTCSTPPTSPSVSSRQIDTQDHTDRLFISRNYRLLPVVSGVKKQTFRPRIYLQGVEEATHGLSDTLLSVLGVRAGEVVSDLCSYADT